jgi:hypothetical protein
VCGQALKHDETQAVLACLRVIRRSKLARKHNESASRAGQKSREFLHVVEHHGVQAGNHDRVLACLPTRDRRLLPTTVALLKQGVIP